MNTATRDRTTITWLLTLGLLLAALLAMPLATAPADAAVSSGKALSWGLNDQGQLGNGADAGRITPGAVKNLAGVESAKGGCYHGLALKQDGTVRAWGDNFYGQLGNGTNGPSKVPVRVKNLTDVKAVSAGCVHNLALKRDGSVWAWGYNFSGQLGNGTSGSGSSVPVQVANLGTGARGIAAGHDFSLALMQDGTVRSWGRNSVGQLGNGNFGPNTGTKAPAPVIRLSGVRAISGGAYDSFAVLENGKAKSWGHNTYGELGDGTSYSIRYAPAAVKNLTEIRNLDGGRQFTLAVTR